MQAHGGVVEVESREGIGSSFILIFPMARSTAV
jgi:signal transduction histidine kinase